MIGQLYWYLLAAQFRRLQVTRRSEKKVTPILGIYFENFNVRIECERYISTMGIYFIACVLTYLCILHCLCLSVFVHQVMGRAGG